MFDTLLPSEMAWKSSAPAFWTVFALSASSMNNTEKARACAPVVIIGAATTLAGVAVPETSRGMTLQPSKVLAAVLDSKPQLAQVLPCWSAQAKVGLRWKHVQLPLVHTPNGGDVHAVLSGRLVWVGQVPVESQVTPGVHSVPVVPQALLGTHWVHALARQTVFAGQALPQRAQLPALFVRSTHALLQFVWVDAQQIPLEQFGVVPPQAWPHVPQLV